MTKLAWNKARPIEVGEVFGSWEVISESVVVDQKTRATCRCKCGSVKSVLVTILLSGKGTRCHGCAVATHRQTYSPAWTTWSSMHTRCKNPHSDQYERYGGRGIKICSEWEDFKVFLDDMGERPEGMTLDRIDTNGDYSKNNCRWATAKEQATNRSTTRWVEYEGKKYSATDLAKHLDISYAAIIGRLNRGAKLDEPIKKNMQRTCKHKSTDVSGL